MNLLSKKSVSENRKELKSFEKDLPYSVFCAIIVVSSNMVCFDWKGVIMAKQTTYNVGIYVRLSQEDERAGESLSIENQKKMLTEYVSKLGRGGILSRYARTMAIREQVSIDQVSSRFLMMQSRER